MFSIIIPVFNNVAYTIACLRDLSHLSRDEYEVIVVDNGSTDGTKKYLETNSLIKYKRLDKNYGFAVACNIGYSLAAKDNIMFLNNDIKVNADFDIWPESLAMECKFGLVSPTMGILDDNLNFIKEANHLLAGKNSYLSGWCLSAHKDIWKKLEVESGKVFKESSIAYFEDTDLSFRAKKMNIPLYCKTIPVIHYGRKTSALLDTNKLYVEAKKIFIKNWGNK